MTLDKKRVSEMFWEFSHILPIYDSNQKQAESILGTSLIKLVPDLALTIANICKNNLETLDLFLDYIQEATSYMRNETNELPDIDRNQEELTKIMKESIDNFEKNAKPIKL